MDIHSGHRKRLRERFAKEGLASFADHEILELILFFALPRIDTNPVAHRLIAHFGSLYNVLNAHMDDLKKIEGVGENAAVLISLFKTVFACYRQRSFAKRPRLDTIEKAGEYCASYLAGKKYETLLLVCLDTQFRVNHTVELQEGTLNEITVYPRVIVEIALRYNAGAVIMAHNHPGDSPSPSQADVQTTQAVLEALKPLNISLADHIITGNDSYYSFSANNLLKVKSPFYELPAAAEEAEKL